MWTLRVGSLFPIKTHTITMSTSISSLPWLTSPDPLWFSVLSKTFWERTMLAVSRQRTSSFTIQIGILLSLTNTTSVPGVRMQRSSLRIPTKKQTATSTWRSTSRMKRTTLTTNPSCRLPLITICSCRVLPSEQSTAASLSKIKSTTGLTQTNKRQKTVGLAPIIPMRPFLVWSC